MSAVHEVHDHPETGVPVLAADFTWADWMVLRMAMERFVAENTKQCPPGHKSHLTDLLARVNEAQATINAAT